MVVTAGGAEPGGVSAAAPALVATGREVATSSSHDHETPGLPLLQLLSGGARAAGSSDVEDVLSAVSTARLSRPASDASAGVLPAGPATASRAQPYRGGNPHARGKGGRPWRASECISFLLYRAQRSWCEVLFSGWLLLQLSGRGALHAR